jgi:hypothetical protein
VTVSPSGRMSSGSDTRHTPMTAVSQAALAVLSVRADRWRERGRRVTADRIADRYQQCQARRQTERSAHEKLTTSGPLLPHHKASETWSGRSSSEEHTGAEQAPPLQDLLRGEIRAHFSRIRSGLGRALRRTTPPRRPAPTPR